MLARRFTIVCLLIALFGMSLAILVADKNRATRAAGAYPFVCDLTRTMDCPYAARR